MYFWNSYPFIRFSIALILGIVAFDYFPLLWHYSPQVLLLLAALFACSVGLSHRLGFYKMRHYNGVLALSILFFLGGYLAKDSYHDLPKNHYKYLSKEIYGFVGVINSPVNERTNHDRYEFSLSNIIVKDSIIDARGKIHLYIKKDSLSPPFQYGDKLLVVGKFYPVPGPDNPHEFDYKKYLQRENIYAHAFVPLTDTRILDNTPPNYFLKIAFHLRKSASQVVDKYIPSSRENGIAKALILGIKDHLESETKQAFSAAGAMHVLAVSGLHVGIIFLMLSVLIGKLKNRGKWGRIAFGLVTVSAIWLYAALTGLSPSVLRAATMFTMVAIGETSSRSGNIYNTLGFAAFILLLANPYLAYSVGFQLSFAAVFGIVYLQPKLYRLLYSPHWLIDKAWAITCVSIAAQLATFPLSAYYFHQFPTYFLASNLIVIPASFIILTAGISMLILELILPALASYIGFCLGWFLWLLNEIISLIHLLPNSLIEWIYMDVAGLILTYLIVITFISGLHYRSFKTLVVSSLLGLFFVGYTLADLIRQAKVQELIFYEISNKIAIDHINGHHATLYIDRFRPVEMELLSFQVNPNRLASHLRPIKEAVILFDQVGFEKKDVLHFGSIAGKKIVIIDSTTFHLDFKKPIRTDLLIIHNQAVKNLKWLTEHFEFDQVIFSNRNSSFYLNKMKLQASRLDINMHSLKQQGALRIPLAQAIKKERALQPALFTTNPD